MVTQKSSWGLRDSARVLSERNLAWFWKTVAEGSFSATVAISRLGADGYPVSRLARTTVEREEGADNWVRLACEVQALDSQSRYPRCP
jgi:hypothetical protein